MLSADEVANRMLSELEEWGRENIPTLMNTIFPPEGTDDERELSRAALNSLLGRGLIVIEIEDVALDTDAGRTLLSDIKPLVPGLYPDGAWKGGADPWPEIRVTPTGRQEAERLLHEKGYQWWRHGVRD